MGQWARAGVPVDGKDGAARAAGVLFLKIRRLHKSNNSNRIMAYFKLQLTGTDDRPLLDSDLDVAEFEPLAGNIVALLVRQRVLPADGKVEVRIIPRADDSPNFQRPVVLGVTGMGECREGLEILFEKAQPPIEQVAYWTLQLRGRGDEVDLPH